MSNIFRIVNIHMSRYFKFVSKAIKYVSKAIKGLEAGPTPAPDAVKVKGC